MAHNLYEFGLVISKEDEEEMSIRISVRRSYRG
jgi:hypothetical protein